MNPLIQLKTTPPLLIILTLLCFGLLPRTQAVVPPPDGGYPGFNTAEGQKALFSLTTGTANTAVGWYSLFSNAGGNFNTATGAGSLLFNTADDNTAFGAAALLFNTTGFNNTANGAFALYSNTTGLFNTANGWQALFSNTTGGSNTATGEEALRDNTTGVNNTANGQAALLLNTTGHSNTADGVYSLSSNTTGLYNTANGVSALGGNISGADNTALGFQAGLGVTTADNVIVIGANVEGANVSNTCFIGNIRDVQTQNVDAIPVLIDSAGQLGTMSSSRRFKNEIKPMDKVSEAVLALKPVTFHYKSDKIGTPQFGLIAEEVAAVNPDLVVRDEKGEIYSVRYEAVNAMLLNEFLKEHRKVEDLKKDFQATVAQQQKEIAALAATVKEQASQIQKVSAQLAAAGPSDGGLGLSKFATGRIRRGGPAPQVVSNNQ
jgi:hypothetical protein